MKTHRDFFLLLPLMVLFIVSCNASNPSIDQDEFAKLPKNTEGLSVATFAGGCFWCTEAVFERVIGVKYVISGYSGGTTAFPTYGMVSAGKTDYAEAIQIYYDPELVSFTTLLDVFFKAAHDPTQMNRQGPDVGPQYRSIAFFRDEQEQEQIVQKITELEIDDFDVEIVTEVEPFKKFYPAEKYHQDYYESHQDNSYVYNVSRPKVLKFEKNFPDLLKPEFKN